MQKKNAASCIYIFLLSCGFARMVLHCFSLLVALFVNCHFSYQAIAQLWRDYIFWDFVAYMRNSILEKTWKMDDQGTLR